MTVKEFIDKCLSNYFRVTVTQATDDLRTEEELAKSSHLYDLLRRYPELLDREIDAFTIAHTGTGLCWYISLKRK